MAFAAPPTFTISGQVTAPDGKLASGVKVQLVKVGEVMGMPFPGGSKEQSTDSTARYSFEGLLRGNYYLLAERRDSAVFWRAEQNLTLEKSTQVPLALRPFCAVEITVGDEKDRPQKDARVRLVGPVDVGATTDGSGVARFHDPVPAGAYTMRASVPGRRFALMERKLELGAPEVKMALQLKPVAQLSGRFVDEHGQPARDVEYTFGSRFTATSGDGLFEIPVDEPGERAAFVFGGGKWQFERRELAPGTAPGSLGEVRVRAALPLPIKVTGPDGKPAKGAGVGTHLSCTKGPCTPDPRHTNTLGDGVAWIEAYDGREGEITVALDGAELQTVKLPAGSTRLEVKLETKKPPPAKDTNLSVTLLDGKGKPVNGAVNLDGSLQVVDASGVFETTTSAGTHTLFAVGGNVGYWSQQLIEVTPKKPLAIKVVFPSDTHTLKIRAPWAIFAALAAQDPIIPWMPERWAKMRLPTNFMGQDGFLTAFESKGVFSFSPSGVGPHTVILVDRDQQPHVKTFTAPDKDFEISFDQP
ncbi:MAG: carboxypeptidase-like regulatory domain-containing protein [Myxococcaceae bacterium]